MAKVFVLRFTDGNEDLWEPMVFKTVEAAKKNPLEQMRDQIEDPDYKLEWEETEQGFEAECGGAVLIIAKAEYIEE